MTTVGAASVASVDAIKAPRGGLPWEKISVGCQGSQDTRMLWISKELATLKPVADLRRIYADAGAGHGNKVVTYCLDRGDGIPWLFRLEISRL
jgi:hypothetical protein